MEEDKFARLKAVVRQAREAHETSPEDEDFKQRYENAKAALKRAMDEANAGTTRCILTLHNTNLFFLYQLLPQDLVRKTSMAARLPGSPCCPSKGQHEIQLFAATSLRNLRTTQANL